MSKIDMQKSRVCANCVFWDAVYAEPSKMGYCRVNPPLVQYDIVEGAKIPHGVWPRVNGGNWCGRFNDARERERAFRGVVFGLVDANGERITESAKWPS